jgi:hypothetical protein
MIKIFESSIAVAVADLSSPSSKDISPKKSEGLRIERITSLSVSSELILEILTLPEMIMNKAEPASFSDKIIDPFEKLWTEPDFDSCESVSSLSSENIGTLLKNSIFSNLFANLSLIDDSQNRSL